MVLGKRKQEAVQTTAQPEPKMDVPICKACKHNGNCTIQWNVALPIREYGVEAPIVGCPAFKEKEA
jgi:hypothetical protein